MTFSVVGCSACDLLWLVEDLRQQDTAECPHCGREHQADKLRALGQHDDPDGAREIRTRILAERAGELESYRDTYPAWNKLADDAETRLSRHDDLFSAAVDLDAPRDEWGLLDERPTHTDAFAHEVDDRPFYAGAFADDIESEPLTADVGEDFAGAGDAAGLTICQNPPIGASSYLPNPPVQPAQCWSSLFEQSSLDERLVDAVTELVGHEDRIDEAARALIQDYHVRAIGSDDESGGLYADELVQVLRGDDPRRAEALRLTRRLGRAQPDGVSTTISDVRTGPLRVLEAVGDAPMVVLGLPDGITDDLHHEQRTRWFDFVSDLAEVCDVRLVLSGLEATWLSQHRVGDDSILSIPSRVSEHAHPSLQQQAREDAKGYARDALDELGPENPHWTLLEAVAEPDSEQLRYHDLRNDQRFSTSWDTMRARIKRLRDLHLVETWGPDSEKRIAVLDAGRYALDELEADTRLSETFDKLSNPHVPDGCEDREDGSSCPAVGLTTSGMPEDDDPRCHVDVLAPPVSDPPIPSPSTVLPPGQARRGEGGSPPEAAPEGELRPGSGVGRSVQWGWLSNHRHQALFAAAPSGGIGLVDHPTEHPDDARRYDLSISDDGSELIAEINAAKNPHAMLLRLCSALTEDPVWTRLLTPDVLDSILDDRYILRRTRCLGYLKDEYDADDYRERLIEERNALLSRVDEIYGDDGFDEEKAATLCSDAQGLMGTMMQLLDLANVDVVRHIKFPDWSRHYRETTATVLRTLSRAVAIGGRYGHYSAYRVLYEDRDDRREDLLSAPDVTDPHGDVLGRWVLSGDGIEDMAGELGGLEMDLQLQEDEEKFAPFVLDAPVESGWRREVVAEILARMDKTKNLHPTRRAVSLFFAFAGSPFDVAEAVGRALGHESIGHGRDLELAEVRFALAWLPAGRIVPDAPGQTVSKVLHALMDADAALSGADLAAAAGVSKQSIRNNRDLLAALGLVEIDEQGPGQATLYRLKLPFRDERREEAAPEPDFLATTPGATDEAWIHDVVADVLGRLGVDVWSEHIDTWTAVATGDKPVTALVDLAPCLDPWIELLVALVGERGDRAPASPRPTGLSARLGAPPEAEQDTLDNYGTAV